MHDFTLLFCDFVGNTQILSSYRISPSNSFYTVFPTIYQSSLAKLDAGIWKTFHEHKFPSLERIHLEHCNKVNIFGDGEGNVDDAIEIKDGKCIFSCEANTFEIIVSERIVEEDDDEDGQDGDEDEDCLDVESEIEPEVGGDISEGGEDRNNSKAFKEKDR